MSQYRYVILNNAGHSWSLQGSGEEAAAADQTTPLLTQLLQDGWMPVRETPMGGGTSPLAHSLILLERLDRGRRPRRGKRSAAD